MQLPEKVISELTAVTGEKPELIERSFQKKVNTSIRTNPEKFSGSLDLEPVPWCGSGYFLPERPAFVTDPLFHGGAYYVQESSSMFIEHAIKQLFPNQEALTVLDLCAAPGGKATHLLSLLSEDSVLIANEVIRTRANILSENISKWGYPNQAVINSDPKFIGESEFQFDLVLVDAPCSGEGLFRRDPSAIDQWSEENVSLCAARQKRILADIWPAVRPGGILIYSTCTFNRHENEENLAWMQTQFDLESIQLHSIHRSILETESNGLFGYRFVPITSFGEGFFMTVVRKTGYEVTNQNGRGRGDRIQKLKASPALEFISPPDTTRIIELNGTYHLVSQSMDMLLEGIRSLRPVSIGTELGKLKGKDFIPSQPLANSIHINGHNQVELTHEEALTFLALGNLNVSANKGWHLVTFEGIGLGFIKSLGNRSNNYFPKEWRIRTDLTKYPKPLFSLGKL